MTKKIKPQIVAIGVFGLAALLSGFIFFGHVGDLVMCRNPATHDLGLFLWKDHKGHAIGDAKVTCDVMPVTAKDNIWKPFALSRYGLDEKGICYRYEYRNYTTLAHATGSKFNILNEIGGMTPVFQTSKFEKTDFTDLAMYCSPGAIKAGCVVEVVPICSGQTTSEGEQYHEFKQYLCAEPASAISVDTSPAYEGLNIARMIFKTENQKEDASYAYTYADAWPLKGDVAIVDAGHGRLRCYYEQTQFDGANSRPNHTSWRQASQEEGVKTCMAMMADKRRQCHRDEQAHGPSQIIY